MHRSVSSGCISRGVSEGNPTRLKSVRAGLARNRNPHPGRVFSHSFHRGVESSEKSCVKCLTYFRLEVRLQMVRHFLKSAGPCRGFTVGSQVLQEQIL